MNEPWYDVLVTCAHGIRFSRPCSLCPRPGDNPASCAEAVLAALDDLERAVAAEMDSPDNHGGTWTPDTYSGYHAVLRLIREARERVKA